MNQSSTYNGSNRRRSQSLCEHSPRINAQLTIPLFNKLIPSNDLPLPVTGNTIIPIVESTDDINHSEKKRRIFFICEPILTGFIIFPLLIIFWQSGWNFMIEWLNTSIGQYQSLLISLYFLSQIIFLIIYTNQDHVYNFFINKIKSKYLNNILLQLYTLITALNYIVQWVSMWTLLDRYTSNDWVVMLIISIAAILALFALTGHLSDLVCAPFIISYDSIEYNIRIGSPFLTEKMNQYICHILNYIFYEHIISLLTILSWRGTYMLLDVYLYPYNENISASISLSIGYLSYFILMYTQFIENNLCFLPTFINLNYPSFLKNFRHLCAFLSCVLLWRGYWILFDEHIATISFIYELPYIGYFILMLISFIILSLMKTASSTNGFMSHIDDEYNLFPLYSNCLLVKWFNKNTNSNKSTNIQPYTITVF